MARKQPYTFIGIGRKKCERCGEPAQYQWQICSLKNWYYPICGECDIKLNETVLKFMGISGRKKIIQQYSLTVR